MSYKIATAVIVKLFCCNRNTGGTWYVRGVCRSTYGSEFRIFHKDCPEELKEGRVYTFDGESFSRLYQRRRYEELEIAHLSPSMDEGPLLSYLTGPEFPNVGKRTAEKLFSKYGKQALFFIDHYPERLRQDGFSDQVVTALVDGRLLYSPTARVRSRVPFLTPSQLKRIVEYYGDDTAADKFCANPYEMVYAAKARCWRNFSFPDMDKVFLYLYPGQESCDLRLGAAIYHAASSYLSDVGSGMIPDTPDWTFWLAGQVCRPEVLGQELTPKLHQRILALLSDTTACHLRHAAPVAGISGYYLPEYLVWEENVSNWIARRLSGRVSFPRASMSGPDLVSHIRQFETCQTDDLRFTDAQKLAVLSLLSRTASVLIGVPGCGKTTTASLFAYLYLQAFPEGHLHLLAPTGAAASRMESIVKRLFACCETDEEKRRLNEQAGAPCTIANFLCRGGGLSKNEAYFRNDLFLIDETGMVPLCDLSALCSGALCSARVLFLGDVDQLPSIGSGRVLRDLIDCLPYERLATSCRQGARGQAVAVNAAHMRQGEGPQNWLWNDSFSCRYYPSDAASADFLAEQYVAYYRNWERVNAVSPEPVDVALLCPMKSGPAGPDMLNARIQDVLNPEVPVPMSLSASQTGQPVCLGTGTSVRFSLIDSWQAADGKKTPVHVRIGSRIVVTENIYMASTLIAVNGSTGFLRSAVYDEDSQDVTFAVSLDNGKQISFVKDADWDGLRLGYAITVHKAQGNEYNHVLVSIQDGLEWLLARRPDFASRNLLYTAITRARCDVTLCGAVDPGRDILGRMVQHPASDRFSLVKARVDEQLAALPAAAVTT